ncbi:MAG: threonine--tRNA ligase [Gammaproteobacteria bacterium]|nr:MAG: threonine--tRNA ligase [Gammaproteobacteria bacterium]RKZ43367.1 MAG: threonine--tRNA ligase [Gammaproteobacteria bacterium]RKZ74438.1 MAG: threonine--tRNA ligase [Gammaproteobacteria bacterium]
MPIITLPDGSQRHFENPITVKEVAANIGQSLAKSALAGKMNDRLVDTSTIIEDDVQLAIITDRDPDGLEIIRHSCAHLMAQAVKSLFPIAQATIGPVVENGFYYDFAYPKSFTLEDLDQIQAQMEKLVSQNHTITRSVMSRDEATAFFRTQGEEYKAQIIESIPTNEELSLYQQGNFTDLCRGPHVPSTGKLKAFKLMKVAGAYWRGDSNNEMLQRIYGTAWANKKELKAYLYRLEEAEKRDHRKLGKQLDLFHVQEEAPGMIFWHDKGWSIYLQIQDYIRRLLHQHGYQEVHTPQLVDRSLWEKSGHWDKFGKEMFSTHLEHHDYVIKPMNCPCHIQIYNQGLKSYRDLPLRMAEFGSCHRNEPSGTLHGLMRIRHFVQDDAHIFCTEEQIQSEVSDFIDLVFKVYADFGFHNIIIKLSTRPQERVGSDEVWDKAEQALELALNNKKLDWELQPGDGAFYGPKVEFSLKDCLDRVWQCGTIQVDFSMPGRLGAEYVASDGSKQTPVMLHRAILGSLERFIGVLLEEYAGALPIWLAPIQAVILNITDQQADYAKTVEAHLLKNSFRVIADLRNEKIGLKIREHTLQKVPYLLIVGGREVENKQVAVRLQKGKDQGAMSLDAFTEQLRADVIRYTNS